MLRIRNDSNSPVSEELILWSQKMLPHSQLGCVRIEREIPGGKNEINKPIIDLKSVGA